MPIASTAHAPADALRAQAAELRRQADALEAIADGLAAPANEADSDVDDVLASLGYERA